MNKTLRTIVAIIFILGGGLCFFFGFKSENMRMVLYLGGVVHALIAGYVLPKRNH